MRAVVIGFISLSIFYSISCGNSNTDKETIKQNSKETSLDMKSDSNPLVKAKKDEDDFLSRMNKEFIEEEKKALLEAKKESKDELNENHIDDGSWVLMINDKKILRSEFAREYHKFLRLSRSKISEKDYINVFLQNYIINNRAKKYFSSGSKRRLINFVKKQAQTQQYIRQNVHKKRIQLPSKADLKIFHQQLITNSQFKNLKLHRHRSKIIKMYKLQVMNQRLHLLSQTLKGKYRIVKNDEWEDDYISKYIKGEIDIRKATGSKYKKYWLYKILLGKPKKTKKKNAGLTNKSNLSSKKETTDNKSVNNNDSQKISAKTKAEIKKNEYSVLEDLKKEQIKLENKQSGKKATENVRPNKVKPIKKSSPDKKDKGTKPSIEKPIEEFELKKSKTTTAHLPQKELSKINKQDQKKPKDNKNPVNIQPDQGSQIDTKESSKKAIPAKSDPETTEKELEVSEPLFKKSRTRSVRSINFYIKDIENKLRMFQLTGMNPQIYKSFRRNPQVRKQYIERFLLEELIYKKLIDKKIIKSRSYRNIANRSAENFMLGYYMKKVLKLRSKDQQRQYIMNYIQSNQIKISDRYFNPSIN